MKNKKKIYSIIAAVAAIMLITIFIFRFVNDENKLNRTEKNWIADNLNVIQNISVINNANVFGDNGTGVFYDFIKDFQTEYRIEINPVTFLFGDPVSGNTFSASNSVGDSAAIFYEDHYVLVGRDYGIYSSADDFKPFEIGILQSDEEYLKGKVPFYAYRTYENNEKLFEAIGNGEINFGMVSMFRNLNKIITNNFVINYHFSDVKFYYYFDGPEDDALASIMKKYFKSWKDKYFDEILNSNEFTSITSSLNLSEADVSNVLSKTYNYGFINQNPYEVITGGNFGGISAVYLKKFSDFSGIDFNFHKYSNVNKFKNAIKNNSINMYLNYYLYDDNYTDIYNYDSISFDIIAPVKSDYSLTNLSINNTDEIYVQKSTKIAKYLAENTSLKLNYYETIKDMIKLSKKGKIIAVDSETFNYFHKNKLKGYESRFNKVINSSYTFKVNASDSFKKLFNTYIQTLDPKVMKIDGINNHNKTINKGEILADIAHYFIYLIVLAILFIYLIYKKSGKVSITKKIRSDEKIKYIDMLTSLKNRNYLSENMEAWNNNNIYPQAMVVIDLNNIAYLNDRKGYEAGDKQITAMANILIKTQLDNSDIMRTNGNEFLVYMVGYQQKHVVNYIHKLTKEMKKLPYEHGAAIGYSMITDDIKTVEDAINEAFEDMKKQKAKSKEV